MTSSISGHENALSIAARFFTVQPVPPVSTGNSHIVQQAFDRNIFPFPAGTIIDPSATYYADPTDDAHVRSVSAPSIAPIKNLNPHPTMPRGRSLPSPCRTVFP
ncbi:unnamed protein product, partial [Ascophyllum nodosum]